MQTNLELGMIGNGTAGALIDERANIVWCCLPRFDSPPVFDALLHHPASEGGLFAIELADLERVEQSYHRNTALLETRLYDSHGSGVLITDFAPRFQQYGRIYHPGMLVRQIQPLAGATRVRVRIRPTNGWSGDKPQVSHGSNHMRFVFDEMVLRLTTNISLTRIEKGDYFFLDGQRSLILGPDEKLMGNVNDEARRLAEETVSYWYDWVRDLHLPFEWQCEVIRAAITLRLSADEDTGAIIAALTTSIPEAPNSGRNWDYRYCWLRDSYYVVCALNRLGTTKTMEHYTSYLMNIAANREQGPLQPVYRIDGVPEIHEEIIERLPGYQGHGPVRAGNQAYLQTQNDSYGSVVMAVAQTFFDQRLENPAGATTFAMLERMGEQAWALYSTPDAGLWEFRNSQRVHTYSALMCWAACDRLARIAAHLELDADEVKWQQRAAQIRAVIEREAWNEEMQCFTESFGGTDLDASMLLLHETGFLRADDPRFISTVEAIERHLRVGDYIFRYAKSDDFGPPETAFLVCTFWYINALDAIGRIRDARALFENLLRRRNRLGLLSEDLDPVSGTLWGNFPQTYSMVGIINCAMRMSRRWEEAF
jgi:GH15 family glucan-1,4-alpha-glucosidase